ncbi:MAG TPA: hypothetical protein VK824_08800 [Planctomycetota bacterium]|nr:hypothetical protein [Planctomycetota bacterium]
MGGGERQSNLTQIVEAARGGLPEHAPHDALDRRQPRIVEPYAQRRRFFLQQRLDHPRRVGSVKQTFAGQELV